MITYKTKVGSQIKKDVVCARDVRDVRRKFSDDYHGMRLLTIAPKKPAPKKEEPEEVKEHGPLGPRQSLEEATLLEAADPKDFNL